MIGIKVEKQLKTEFHNACREHDQSVSQVLRGYIRSYVEQAKAEKKKK